MKEDLNMDKKFRDKLNGLSQAPPPHIWDNIQGSLLAQKRKRRIVFFSRLAAAAVIVLAFLAGWYFNEKTDEIVPESVQLERIEKPIRTPDTNPETLTAESELQEKMPVTAISVKNETTENRLVNSSVAKQSVNVQNENREPVQINRFSLKEIKKLEVIFYLPQNEEFQLGKKEKQSLVISQAEKVLIAENIKTSNQTDKEDPRWKMGLNFAPGYSSQSSSYSQAYSNNMTYSNQPGNGSVSGGFSVQLKAGKKWSVESGIYYAQNGQKSSNSLNLSSADYAYSPLSFDTEKSFFNTAVNNVNGQIAMNSTAGIIQFSGTPEGTERAASLDEAAVSADVILASGEFAQVFDFIEIPLFLRYSLIDAKVGVEIMGGVNAGLVAGNNVFMDNQYGNQKVGKTKDISPVNLSGTIGVGINYALGKNISLAVEPRFNYYLNSINQNVEVNYRPYRIGVYTGLYYEF